MAALATAGFWRALSSALLVVFVVAWALEGFDAVPGWGWLALVASGVAFAIEIALVATRGRRA